MFPQKVISNPFFSLLELLILKFQLAKLQEKLNMKSQPAILHRSNSTNSVNPFGPTFFYLYEDIIFEIMTNGYIASVTLIIK